MRACMGTRAHSTEPLFHAECDIAAVVYGPAEEPDIVLAGFVGELRKSGCRVAGLIQRGGSLARYTGRRLSAMLLPSGREITLAHHGMPRSTSCCLEAQGVSRVGDTIATAIHEGADLLVINRYGKLEVEGGGFLDEIALAMALDTPVVVAVPERNFRAWTAYCGGMSVKLACKRGSLDSWWRSVCGAAPAVGRREAPTFCGIAK